MMRQAAEDRSSASLLSRIQQQLPLWSTDEDPLKGIDEDPTDEDSGLVLLMIRLRFSSSLSAFSSRTECQCLFLIFQETQTIRVCDPVPVRVPSCSYHHLVLHSHLHGKEEFQTVKKDFGSVPFAYRACHDSLFYSAWNINLIFSSIRHCLTLTLTTTRLRTSATRGQEQEEKSLRTSNRKTTFSI